MMTPEERREYTKWRNTTYAEHKKFRARVNTLRKRGIQNPEEVALQERKKAKELAEIKELEEEFPWLRVGRLREEKREKDEARKKRAEERRRLKESEDYVNRLIALEESQWEKE